GGAGDLGSRVVRDLARRGHDAVSASRRSGVDLGTGAGLDRALDRALDGAAAVINCADDPRRGDAVTVDGARRLAEAAASRGTHLVHISIVGIDGHPLRYYRRKLAAERALAEVGGPVTVLRATQFHSLAAFFARALTRGRLTFTFGDLRLQPVDTEFVAARLVDLALGPGPAAYDRATDVAGPEVLTIAELATMVRGHRGVRPPVVVRLPPVGRTLGAVAAGGNLPSPGAADIGGRRFAEWLAEQPPVLSGR
ncbi:SDR family oxidoreductase, partial [Intrasporangium sp.]|uniref:SDR family oxidoreductase n=1 Tax=Intrasporangium sp. TaxID=1925024 RepID=UPI00293A8446